MKIEKKESLFSMKKKNFILVKITKQSNMTCAKKEMRPLLLLAMVSPLFYWLSSGQNGFFTTYLRYSRSCFSLFILIAWCRPAFSQPNTRCSKSWPSTISQNALFTTSIHGVQSPTPWNKSGFFKTWRAVSKNSFLLSAELNGLFTT